MSLANKMRISLYNPTSGQLNSATDLDSLSAQHSSLVEVIRSRNGVRWLNLRNPTLLEILRLADLVQLHPLTVEDIQNKNSAEKFEVFENYSFVEYSLGEDSVFNAIITDSCLVTFVCGEVEFQPELIIKRLSEIKASVTDGWSISAANVCYVILGMLTESFKLSIKSLEKEARFIEHELFIHNGESDCVHLLLKQVCEARAKSVDLMNTFQGKAPIIRGLTKLNEEKRSNSSSYDHLLLTGTYNQLRAMKDTMYILDDVLSRNFVNYISIMRVKMVHSNSRMEQIVSGVALAGVVMAPSHVIASAWAMNCVVPGHFVPNTNWFWGVSGAIIFCTIVAAVAAYWYYTHAIKQKAVGRFTEIHRIGT